MNMSTGWIKLYRCLLDDAVCQKSAYFHLWVTLLLMANHKEHEFIFNNEIHKVTPGQLITGRKKLSRKTRIHESTIQRALKCFETEQMIEQQNLGKYRLITIKNWDIFQSAPTGEQAIQQPVNSQRTAPEHHVNTYKNEKNVKNEKNIYIHPSSFSSEQKDLQRIRQANEREMQKFLKGED
jgi:DNA-binding transcriptional MocR family regulator